MDGPLPEWLIKARQEIAVKEGRHYEAPAEKASSVNHGMVRLTYEIIHSAGSCDGHGFNAKQLKLLGLDWPPRKGWLRLLNGREITEETWARVLALKGMNKSKWKNTVRTFGTPQLNFESTNQQKGQA